MNAHSLAHQGYSKANRQTRTPRSIEYELIARVSHRLRSAAMSKGPDAFPKLVEALSDNRKLWAALAIDVADSGNQLPDSLRAQIFYLAEFVQAHSAQVLNKKAKLAPLLEINAAMLRGLRQQGHQS